MKNSILSILLLFISFCGRSQTDSSSYTLYKEKFVVYSDLGFSAAPFSIRYPFTESIKVLNYKNNFKAILGLGVSYKWFALRLGIPLPGNIRPVSRFGRTINFDLGVDFTIKKTFCDIDIKNYKGYAIRNAKQWNDTLDGLNPHDIRPNTNATSFSINVWYFHEKDFKMTALRGKVGHYNREVKTWYLKNTLNVFGVGNNNESIVPDMLIDPKITRTAAYTFSSADIGVIPGYAYVNRMNNWQYSALVGLGAVVQTKFYAVDGFTRGFLGLAPRYDIRLIGGYSVPNYFVFLLTDFDNKSIRFDKLVYRQYYYTIRLVGGYRFKTKEKDKKKN